MLKTPKKWYINGISNTFYIIQLIFLDPGISIFKPPKVEIRPPIYKPKNRILQAVTKGQDANKVYFCQHCETNHIGSMELDEVS